LSINSFQPIYILNYLFLSHLHHNNFSMNHRLKDQNEHLHQNKVKIHNSSFKEHHAFYNGDSACYKIHHSNYLCFSRLPRFSNLQSCGIWLSDCLEDSFSLASRANPNRLVFASEVAHLGLFRLYWVLAPKRY